MTGRIFHFTGANYNLSAEGSCSGQFDFGNSKLWVIAHGADTDRKYIAKRVSHRFQDNGLAGLRESGDGFVALIYNRDSGALICYRSLIHSPAFYWRQSLDGISLSENIIDCAPSIKKPLNIDRSAVAYLFTHLAPPARGYFLDISLIPAGTEVRWTGSEYQTKMEYPRWLATTTTDVFMDEKAAVEEWKHAFLSMGERYRAGSYGLMLSGGLDSGAIAGVLSRNVSKPQMHAISWSFPGKPDIDETDYIHLLCKQLGIKHHLFSVEGALPFDGFDGLPFLPSLPSFNPFRNLINQVYRRAADRGVDALLNGHCGDYLYYAKRCELYERLRRRDYMRVISGCLHELKHAPSQWKHSARLRELYRRCAGLDPRMLPTQDWATESICDELPDKNYGGYNHGRRDQMQMLIGSTKMDEISAEAQYSEMFGVQRVHPLADKELISLALRTPAFFLNKGKCSKWIARQALKGIVPNETLVRPRVGLLGDYAQAGWLKNRENVLEYLFREDRWWSEFVSEKWLIRASHRRFDGVDGVLITMCLGLELWRDGWASKGYTLVLE